MCVLMNTDKFSTVMGWEVGVVWAGTEDLTAVTSIIYRKMKVAGFSKTSVHF